MIVTILAFIFVFGILVFAHEFGHYLTARLFKVKVEEFAFGFPPRIWSKKKGETEYSVNAIPIGGYVRLLGEDWRKSKSSNNLMNKKAWQKIIIFGAGVLMNVLLAWVLMTGFYAFGGMPVVPDSWNYPGITNNQKVYIIEVAESEAVKKAGIQNNDRLIKVGDTIVYRHQEASDAIDKLLAEDKTKPILLSIVRDNVTLEKSITAYEENGKELLGFGLENKGYIKSVWYLAPVTAAREIWHITTLTVKGFVEFFGTLFTKFKISENVGGPVAIFKLSGVAANMGPAIFIQFIVILSISLGVLNIMPFPALDGGHIMLVLLEKLRGKEIPKHTKETVLKWGFGLLLLLVAVISINDISRLGLFDFLKGVFKK